MSYFVLLYNPKTVSSTPLMAEHGGIAEFSSVLQAEEAALNPVAGDTTIAVSVYDFAKFEKPVPLIPPGTTMLVDGQWIVTK